MKKKEAERIIQILFLAIAFVSLIISAISLYKTTLVDIDLNEVKTNLIEANEIFSDYAIIENIRGVECVVFKSGGSWCSAGTNVSNCTTMKGETSSLEVC